MRRSKNTWLACLAVVLLGATGACTNDSLDDGSSADVIMEVVSLDAPAIRAQRNSTTQGTCSLTGALCSSNSDCGATETCLRQDVCNLEVEEWSASIRNAPKNSLGTGTYNDLIMISAEISYAWVNPAIFTPNAVVGLGNVIIPSEGTGQITFFPISSDSLANPAIEGATANLTIVFNARTVEGTSVRQTVLRQLQVEVCN